jgi:UDP-glucose 6-dehydrogenase
MSIVGSDWRIGRKFTKPGYAVGGQCFPRDLKSLIDTFRNLHVEPRILKAVHTSNRDRVFAPMNKIEGQRILVLGTSYKEGLKDERGSQAHKLVARLRARGYLVTALDPKFCKLSAIRTELGKHDTIIVTIPETRFRKIGMWMGRQTKTVLDFANVVDLESMPPEIRLWQAGRGWVSKNGREQGRGTTLA